MSDKKLAPANNLRQYREWRCLTQKELADKAGVREQTIGNIETRRVRPSMLTKRGIAQALGIPSEEIFPLESSSPEQPNTKKTAVA